MIIVSSEDFGKVKDRGLKDTDSGHNLIPRPQKNSSRRAPLLKWTRIKMERFVQISSFFSPLLSFCPRWPLKNLLQQFLLVNSSASCSPSRSLTSLLRMNKLFWEDTSQKWNVTCTAKTFSLGLKVDPPLSHILVKLGFLCFWASRASLVFLPPVFKHIHLLWEARGEKMRKIDTSRGKYKGPSSKVQKIQVVRIVQHFVSEVFPFWTKNSFEKHFLSQCGSPTNNGEFSAVKHHFWWSFQTEYKNPNFLGGSKENNTICHRTGNNHNCPQILFWPIPVNYWFSSSLQGDAPLITSERFWWGRCRVGDPLKFAHNRKFPNCPQNNLLTPTGVNLIDSW